MKKTDKYKMWDVYDEMPEGYRIDKTCGSPLAGCVFINDGISVIRGGKRALLRVRQPQQQLRLDAPTIAKMETVAAQSPKVEHPYPARTVNELARERFKLRLLNDIRCDLMICEIEGWGKLEYLDDIKSLINSIGSASIISQGN